MLKKKAHGLTLTYTTFVWFLASWASLMRGVFALWNFLALAHMGQGLALRAGPN